MRRLLVLAATSCALLTSACVTVIDAADDDNHVNWKGANAQPFDTAYAACRASEGRDPTSRGFANCMADKGWSRDDR